jgi:hypothetical protein
LFGVISLEQEYVNRVDWKYYISIPSKIMNECNLKPIMSARIVPKKDGFVLENFCKTVKIKVDLKKKDLEMVRAIMRREGYASIDETINNVIGSFAGIKAQSVYIYPQGFIESGYDLIEDYERALKRKPNRRDNWSEAHELFKF